MAKGREDGPWGDGDTVDLNDDSTVLARRAREGDRAALEELYRRYYERWLRRFHGRLQPDARRVYDTVDLIQSAMREVIAKVSTLRSEAAFFSWVTAVIERKMADASRRLGGRAPLPLEDTDGAVAGSETTEGMVRDEQYLRTLDCMIDLFPKYQDSMCIWYLRHMEQMAIDEIARVVDSSRSKVEKYLGTARNLILSRLSGG